MSKKEIPLFDQLATACPRTNVRIIQPELGGFDILWKNNLSKLHLGKYYTHDGEAFVSESATPSIYKADGSILEQPDYTLIYTPDSKGRIWIMEVLSPAIDNQEICFNLNQDGKVVRFLYAYDTSSRRQQIQRVSLELDANGEDRFRRDNAVARFSYQGNQRLLSYSKVRLNQRIGQTRVKAHEQRLRSNRYHHQTSLDDEAAIQLQIENSLKIIADTSIRKHEEVENYIEELSCVREETDLALLFPLLSKSESSYLSTSAQLQEGVYTVTYSDGDIEVTSGDKSLLQMSPNKILGKSLSEEINPGKSDINTFLYWVNEELQRVEILSDEIFTF